MRQRPVGRLQLAQRHEAGEELGVQQARPAGLGVAGGERIGALGVALAQPPSGQDVALVPERRHPVGGRAPLGGGALGFPQSQRVVVLAGAAQPARLLQHQAGVLPLGFGQGGDQGGGVRRVAAQRQPRLGMRAVGLVQPGDLALCGGGVGPGEPVEPRPLIGAGEGRGPALQEMRLPGRVGNPGDPGAAGRGGGVIGAAEPGVGVGAAALGGGRGHGK